MDKKTINAPKTFEKITWGLLKKELAEIPDDAQLFLGESHLFEIHYRPTINGAPNLIVEPFGTRLLRTAIEEDEADHKIDSRSQSNEASNDESQGDNSDVDGYENY